MKDLAALVINFNTSALTSRCIQSLLEAGVVNVLVLDNGSATEDFLHLRTVHEADERVTIIRSAKNLGFAEGSNRLIDEALSDPRCQHVLLLNSDAVLVKAGFEACLKAMKTEGHDLIGGRMLKPGVPPEMSEAVDSLGIALYKCLLASNRQSTTDAYLGPTGGFALYSRSFLEEVRRLHGYVFDPMYFCYAEDTDLCVRARLMGCAVGYTDEIVAYHEGQGSNLGQYNEFILYHGIRNSIWMVAKSIPLPVVLRHLPWVFALHLGIVVRHTLLGQWRTVIRLYWDAFAGLPRVLSHRRSVQSSRRVPLGAFRRYIDPRFYETRFLKGAIRDLFRRR